MAHVILRRRPALPTRNAAERALRHGLFVVLENKGQDIDHLAIATRLLQAILLQAL